MNYWRNFKWQPKVVRRCCSLERRSIKQCKMFILDYFHLILGKLWGLFPHNDCWWPEKKITFKIFRLPSTILKHWSPLMLSINAVYSRYRSFFPRKMSLMVFLQNKMNIIDQIRHFSEINLFSRENTAA